MLDSTNSPTPEWGFSTEPSEQPVPRALYVVVREDLSSGLRAAQAAHAVAEICLRRPEAAWKWHEEGNYLIVLGAKNEEGVLNAFFEAKHFDMPRELFREPDLHLEATAVAMFPEPADNHVFGDYPLACRETWVDRFVRWTGAK